MATIVVLEDDPVIRQLVIRVLEMDGHKVCAFEDAKPALASVDFSRVDLVLTDLMMPTPGEEAIQTLRERGVTVPIAVMSGHLDREVLRRLDALGVQGRIPKPFSLMDLQRLVKSLV